MVPLGTLWRYITGMFWSMTVLLTATLIVNLSETGAGSSEKEKAAEDLIRQGVALRRAGDHQAALRLFSSAYEQHKSGRTAGQFGLSEQALGMWVEAEKHLEEALASRDPWVQRSRTILEQSLDDVRLRISSLDVQGEPAGAMVRINGREVGKLPLSQPVRVPEGATFVEVEAEGFGKETRQLGLAGGKSTEIVLRLKTTTRPSGPKVEASPSVPVIASIGDSAESRPATQTTTAASDRQPSLSLVWWGAGVTAVIVAAAVVFFATRESDYPKADVTGRF